MNHSKSPSRRVDVVILGELLLDLFPMTVGVPLRNAGGFTMHLGGAPANVAVALARLGHTAALQSAIGEDEFGAFLFEGLAKEGVIVGAIRVADGTKTPLTFVGIDADGERSFHSLRGHTADRCFNSDSLDLEMIGTGAIFHFGSNFMTTASNREATDRAIAQARKAGALVSFDPNLRPQLWDDPERGVTIVRETLDRVDLLKVSAEESEQISGTAEYREAWETRYRPAGVQAAFITDGPQGATVLTADHVLSVPAPKIQAVDTTGAGDAFFGTALGGICEWLNIRGEASPREVLANRSVTDWEALLVSANAAAGAVCTELGATTALPRRERQ